MNWTEFVAYVAIVAIWTEFLAIIAMDVADSYVGF